MRKSILKSSDERVEVIGQGLTLFVLRWDSASIGAFGRIGQKALVFGILVYSSERGYLSR
jgi:hypothetical protein